MIITGIDNGYANRVLAMASDVGREPVFLSFGQLAGRLLVGGTARRLLTNAALGSDDTVVVHGGSAGSGGVGLLDRCVSVAEVPEALPADRARAPEGRTGALAFAT